ncbi:MAG TPA: response regulator transcription factor [Phototrophicaceae bacterium]|jgi:NarL family two-component system response regulator LiaR|nr:response regulator transcription factor [Phototrophicaceae bacterium]
MRPIRVMIVDDHEVVRRGLSIFLRAFADLTLVGQAANGREAVTLCEEVKPQVILMDLMMPEMDGITATRLIRQRYPEIQIVALTSNKDETNINDMLEAGAISYLLKNTSIMELASTILAACPIQSD